MSADALASFAALTAGEAADSLTERVMGMLRRLDAVMLRLELDGPGDAVTGEYLAGQVLGVVAEVVESADGALDAVARRVAALARIAVTSA